MKTRKRHLNTKKQTNTSSRSRGSKHVTTTIPRTMPSNRQTWSRRGMPPELDVQLLYTTFITSGAGSSSAYKRFNPNCYIPEFGGTQAAAEYVTYASIYDFYRVIRFRVEIDLVNQDTTTATLAFLCHNEDFNGVTLGDIAGNPFAQTKVVGSVNGGASRSKWFKEMNVTTLVGSNAPETADSYRAVINANPADVVWAGFGLFGAGTMTSGVAGTVRITQWIRFYNADLTVQTTAPSLTSKQVLDLIQAQRDGRKTD